MKSRVEYKIAICDDVSSELEALEDMLINYTGRHNVEFNISEFDSGEELLEAYEKKEYDIMFLDIQLIGMSGIDLAKRIRKKDDQNTIIIFISNHSGFMKDAFDVQPFHYLEKQFFGNDKKEEFRIKLESVLDDAIKKLNNGNENHLVILKNKDGNKVLYRIKDIVYIESVEGEEGVLRVAYHNEDHDVVDTLKRLYDLLNGYGFIYVSRWCIANISHISELDNQKLYMDNDRILLIGRSYHMELKRQFSSSVLGF